MNQNKVLSVRNLVLIAMFSALAAVLETSRWRFRFAPPFYKLDFADAPGTDRRLCHGDRPRQL